MTQPAVPFYILCGSLGAGKTTLLMRLLEHWKRRSIRAGVLMNEAGEISIDGPRVGTMAEQVMNLAGGCVCCDTKEDLSWGIAELVRALWDLVTGGYAPTQALDQLSDERLLTVADTILMDGSGPDLSEQTVADALKVILVARNEAASRSVVAAPPEQLTDEQLLEWKRMKRSNPRISRSPGEEDT